MRNRDGTDGVRGAIDVCNYPLRLVAKVFLEPQGRAACEKEYNILKELQNDNIVKCVGKPRYMSMKYSFLLLEMMPKGSLLDLYRDEQIKPEQAKCYVRQILQALVHIHELGIVHRDIKCANILIGEADICKLADFSRATKLEGGEELQSGKGDLPSVFWAAPEVQIVGKIPYVPEDLPQDARRFIQRCIQRDPKKRPTALQLLDDDYVRVREETSSSDNSFSYTDQFNMQPTPSFMDDNIDPGPLPASPESHIHSCCIHRAFSWLDPRGVPYYEPLKTVEDVLCKHIVRKRRGNMAPPNHCISECSFLQLEDE